MTHRQFEFETLAGPYWSVIDERYDKVEAADTYLQYIAFSRRLAAGTCKRYASDLALYFTWCERTNRQWDDPEITPFQIWLRTTPGPDEPRHSRQALAGPGSPPIRSDPVVDRICMVVCEMFRHLASQGAVPLDILTRLFEVGRSHDGLLILVARRHRLKKGRKKRGAPASTPVTIVRSILQATGNLRDFLLILLMTCAGLRRGEVIGLRLSDMHLLPDSLSLGCDFKGAHVHVVPRPSTNGAVVKGGVGRIVPVPRAVTQVYGLYRRERDRVPQAASCDYVFVNLYQAPLGEPMKAHAVNELLARLSSKVGYKVKPHSLRHTFGTSAVETASIDVVAELMGHAWVSTTQVYLHPDQQRLRDAVEQSSIADLLEDGALDA
ncbi:recombinase XerD [Nocardioides aromaticivorans]|uniref:Recombinase XerD n=1 Tax=Nocardioides aromaticivorans TaxID=200618 RepID=A0ABX7PPT4_9ACTN|nr:tyrosine-type recombinase/integrase [Nocardioides aromaticivorans]QSR27941.1 recombinase XerD [Nocardioides aromaticivorans]